MKWNAKLVAWAAPAVAAALLSLGCDRPGGLFSRGGDDESDTQFTVLLRAFGDPDTHVDESELWRKRLVEAVGWKDVYVIHKADHSELCWGTYPSIPSGQENLRKAHGYVAPDGQRLFQLAYMVPLPGKDVGPPEWNIQNGNGAYTVLVAIFYDMPEADPPYLGRKNKALKYCRQFRQEGHEAYYQHGPAQSYVYVGSFPLSAVQKVEVDGVVRPVVKDRKMLIVMKTFPFLAVNERSERVPVVNPVTGKVSIENTGTYPVPIPQKGQAGAGAVSRPGDPQPR